MKLTVQDEQKKEVFRRVRIGTAFSYMGRVHIKIAHKGALYALLLPEGVTVNIGAQEVVEVFSECHVTVVR